MRYHLAQHGTVFSTRERGADVRDSLEAAVRQVDSADSAILDFTDIELISFSFADEVIGRLLAERAAGNLGAAAIVLTDLGDEVRDAVERSLRRRSLIGVALEGDRLRLLGAPAHLQETFEAALARGEFRTAELAADLKISAPACNNRLKPLVTSGLISREPRSPRSGGREFIYRVQRLPQLATA